MDVQIIKSSAKNYDNIGRHFLCEAACGKHSAVVVIAENYVRVVVQNASNRAWRGMGKVFPNTAAALEAYRTPAIRAIIEAAQTENEVAA